MNDFTRNIFKTVAQKEGTTPEQVEQGIAELLDEAWENCQLDENRMALWRTIFQKEGKPTVEEFIVCTTIYIEEQKSNKSPSLFKWGRKKKRR